jgi:histidine triad (HIT) family protein
MSETLFKKIVAREISANIVYEDDLVLAIRDINPQAPVHILIFPKKVIPRIAEANTDDQKLLGHLLLKAAEIAKELDLRSGYRLVINNGADGGETVSHLHCHILGGRHMAWPPG